MVLCWVSDKQLKEILMQIRVSALEISVRLNFQSDIE